MKSRAEIEAAFHDRMLRVYEQARTECNYVATRFLNMVNEQGGLAAAKQLLRTAGHPEGLTRLWMEKRLDISVEATILEEPWQSLFTADELAIAERRLRELGYSVVEKRAMDERVKKLRTPEECETFAKNAKERGRADLAKEAQVRAVQLPAERYGANSQAEA